MPFPTLWNLVVESAPGPLRAAEAVRNSVIECRAAGDFDAGNLRGLGSLGCRTSVVFFGLNPKPCHLDGKL